MDIFKWLCLLLCAKLCRAMSDSDSVRLEQIEETLADILDRLEQKETRIKLLEKTVRGLEEKVASQDEVIKELREHQENKVKDEIFESEETPTDKGISTLRGNVEKSSKQPQLSRMRRADNENPVAFFAALTNHTTHVGANQNIAFDKVFTNVGSAYNPHGGLFIAPVTGIYVLSATMFAYPSTPAHFYIFKNGGLITRMYHPDTYDTSSMTIVLELEAGDDVSVANIDSDKTLHGNLYCSFSGFLLQQYYSPGSSVVGK